MPPDVEPEAAPPTPALAPPDASAPDTPEPDASAAGPVVSEDGIQRIAAIPAAAVGTRRFGDGAGDQLTWDDPELDLVPRGWVHVVIAGSGAWLGATSTFAEGGGGALSFALDIVLVPVVSLHLRLGVLAWVRAETGIGTASETVRSAIVSPRGFALVGAHLFQLLAVRTGFELGAGFTFDPDANALGFAFLAQVGIRLGPVVELGAEVAVDLREGARVTLFAPASSASTFTEAAPRLGGYVAVTL